MDSTCIFNKVTIILYLIISSCLPVKAGKSTFTLDLNGVWEMGPARNYTQKVIVPGIHTDPARMNEEKLWYRREVTLPMGAWKYATLELKGARFSPEVYVNGIKVSGQNGGMAPTFHLLNHKDVKPGAIIILEIALSSLKDLPVTDASYIPKADQWRSNISSCLWNDVVLKLHGESRIERIIPFIDFNRQTATISFKIAHYGNVKRRGLEGRVEITDKKGNILLVRQVKTDQTAGKIEMPFGNTLEPWSPETPHLYDLKLSLIKGRDTVDQSVIPFGIKEFRVINKKFYLNNRPVTLLGGTVVWHRWMRDQDGVQLGYNDKWFTENVIRRLKEHGANYLRFHLGMPPEFFLDLCDKYGLAVQYEWSFFHGMPASEESLLEQYPAWLDVAMRHPSVVLYHPYNETEGDQLNVVWDALDRILKDYPPLVLEERDVIHVHKYWWSLFENLGLYFDDADQFPKAIMVDEFGGDYLDGNGDMGGYTTEPETFLRFLGRNHTRESRLHFQSLANSKVAEYWRRIGAAGAAPFCILGSWNDGNHWFLGELQEGNPKPVWDGLTCAWSPQSVSLELWDRNFIPGQRLTIPVYLFNETEKNGNFNIRFSIRDSSGKVLYGQTKSFNEIVPFSKRTGHYDLTLPHNTGRYTIAAELLNPPEAVRYPVVSQWEIHVYKARVPDVLRQPGISVASDEPEIISFLKENNIRNVPLSDSRSDIILLSAGGWDKIANQDKDFLVLLEAAVNRGASVILLDAGERYLGQGYPVDKKDLGPLQGVVTKSGTPVKTYNLFSGIRLAFNETAEPESHIHPDPGNNDLWDNIPPDYTWLWNGMRGGLIVPATNMEFMGLSSSAIISQWTARGADEEKIRKGNYYAYQLEGFYEFSENPDDGQIRDKLKSKLKFLIEDAPSLANSINPLAPVIVTDIGKAYKDSGNGQVESLASLVNAGKNLTRTPVIILDPGKDKGRIIVSQLLTKGRLAKGFGEEGLYGIRYDEVAAQFVLNMLATTLKKK